MNVAPFVHDDIVVLSDARWDDPKRVRHKMPAAWAEAGNQVLWVEEPIVTRPVGRREKLDALRRAPLRTVAPRLHVGTPPQILARAPEPTDLATRGRRLVVASSIYRWLARLRMRPGWVVIWQEAALAPLARLVPHRRSLYYASDRYRYNQANRESDQLLEACCRSVDVVFATSDKIRDQLAPFRTECHTIPHAVDARWFRANAGRFPEALRPIPPPRIVFTGVATLKVDFELLGQVARLAPDLQLVIAGPVLSDATEAAARAAAPNLHLLGERDVDELPGFMAAADILMLPYSSDLTRTFSGLPLKMYEYLIAAKPIISTPFTQLELPEPGLVDVEADAEGWVRAIRRRLARPLSDEERKTREAIAEANTYQHRIEMQRRALKRL